MPKLYECSPGLLRIHHCRIPTGHGNGARPYTYSMLFAAQLAALALYDTISLYRSGGTPGWHDYALWSLAVICIPFGIADFFCRLEFDANTGEVHTVSPFRRRKVAELSELGEMGMDTMRRGRGERYVFTVWWRDNPVKRPVILSTPVRMPERLAVYTNEIAPLLGSILEKWRPEEAKHAATQSPRPEQATPATASAPYSYDGESYSLSFILRLLPWFLLVGGGATVVAIVAASSAGWIITASVALVPAAALYHLLTEQSRLVMIPAARRITVFDFLGLRGSRYSFDDAKRFVVHHHGNSMTAWLYLHNARRRTKVKLLATKSGEQAKDVLVATGEILGVDALPMLENIFVE